MRKVKHLLILGIHFLTFLVLQACYTQLAVSKRVFVTDQPGNQWRQEDPSYSESFPDTVQESDIPSDTIVHEHYHWLMDPYDQWFCDDLFWYNPGFHLSFSFGWADPDWYPWYRPPYRPYRPSFWYAGSYWTDPFWYDPYWNFAYYPVYYTGYRYPYWGWYPSVYTADSVPRKKRNWDRRGADSGNRTITRSSNSTEDKKTMSLPEQGLMVATEVRPKKNTRSVQRHKYDVKKPTEAKSTNLHIRRTGSREPSRDVKTPRTIKQIYHRLERFVSRSGYSRNDEQNRSRKSRTATSRKNTYSNSKHVASGQIHGNSSKSSVHHHGKSRSSGTTSSGGRKRTSSKNPTRE